MLRFSLCLSLLAGCHATITPGCDWSSHTVAPDAEVWPGLTPDGAIAIANGRASAPGHDHGGRAIEAHWQITPTAYALLNDGTLTSTRTGSPFATSTSTRTNRVKCTDNISIPVDVSMSIDHFDAPLVLSAELEAHQDRDWVIYQAFDPADVGFDPPEGPWLDVNAATYWLRITGALDTDEVFGNISTSWRTAAASGGFMTVHDVLYSWLDGPSPP